MDVDEAEARMSARVTKILVRIQCPKNLRVPPQGPSTEGESGPKAERRSRWTISEYSCTIPCWSQEMEDASCGDPCSEGSHVLSFDGYASMKADN